MEIRYDTIPEMTIEEFAERENLEMEVRERPLPKGDPMRYHASFWHTAVMDRCFLVGEYGNGSTPEEAIQNYAKKISLKRVAFGALGSYLGLERRDINVPRLVVEEAKTGQRPPQKDKWGFLI